MIVRSPRRVPQPLSGRPHTAFHPWACRLAPSFVARAPHARSCWPCAHAGPPRQDCRLAPSAAAGASPAYVRMDDENETPAATFHALEVPLDDGGMLEAANYIELPRIVSFAGMDIRHWLDTPGLCEWMVYQMRLPRAERYSEEGVSPMVISSEQSGADDDSEGSGRP